MKKSLCTLLLAAITTISVAQATDDGQELINNFFEIYKTKGYEFAFKYTLETNKWIPARGDEMNNIILEFKKDVATMGTYLGNEEIRNKKIGSRFRITSYLVYYDRDPVRFTFELYKNNIGWEISNFVFDFRFDEEAEESIRLTSAAQFR